MLQIGSFKPVEPGTSCVDRLGHLTGNRRTTWRTDDRGRYRSEPRDNWIRQVFVEIASGNHPEGIDIVLKENVHVIRSFRLEAGVADANGDGVRPRNK